MTELVGFIVNPVAGLGGRVGLRGTDGPAAVRRALELGATPVSQERAERAIVRLERHRERISLLAGASAMGADLARAHGFHTTTVDVRTADETTAEDTRAAAAEMERCGVSLILYAGGDGTARDIVDVVGARVPILGIPTGVKMHSGVFATSPEAAGDLAGAYVSAPGAPRLRDAEVMDVDEDAAETDRVSTRLFGVARVPNDPLRVQHPKASSRAGGADLEALCREIARETDGLTLFGPGTTTQRILSHLGVEGTLLGVDAVEDGRLVGRDLNEASLLELLRSRDARLVVGVVGGQGFVFGRGNQQLSAAVIRRIGLDRIVIVASLEKLTALDPPRIHIDTGDPELDVALAGFRRVRVAPGRSVVIEAAT